MPSGATIWESVTLSPIFRPAMLCWITSGMLVGTASSVTSRTVFSRTPPILTSVSSVSGQLQ